MRPRAAKQLALFLDPSAPRAKPPRRRRADVEKMAEASRNWNARHELLREYYEVFILKTRKFPQEEGQ